LKYIVLHIIVLWIVKLYF